MIGKNKGCTLSMPRKEFLYKKLFEWHGSFIIRI